MKKYTLEQFIKKYANKRHISCGINYIDGNRDTIINASFSQIMSYISEKKVAFITTR
jgi:DNA modification methylase